MMVNPESTCGTYPLTPIADIATQNVPMAQQGMVEVMAGTGAVAVETDASPQPEQIVQEVDVNPVTVYMGAIGCGIGRAYKGIKNRYEETRLAQEISVTPTAVYTKNYAYRMGNVIGSIATDVKESDNKPKTIGLGVAGFATQTVDRLRGSVVIVPHVTIEVLKHTQNAGWTALTAGGLLGFWCYGVGKFLNEGLNQYPKTVDSFREEFPAIVEVAGDALPGLSEPREIPETKHFHKTRRLVQKTGMHARRGAASLGLGSTTFVLGATGQGRNKKEIAKINRDTSIDAAITAATVGGILGETVIKLVNNGHYETAKKIQDAVGNLKYWYTLAAGMILLEFVSNRRKNRELRVEHYVPENSNPDDQSINNYGNEVSQ